MSRACPVSVSPRAFTLWEALVVIAIISVLAAVLFPVYNAAKKRSHVAGLTSKFHQAGVASALYSEDWNGAMPFGSSQVTILEIENTGYRYGEPWDSILKNSLTWPESIAPYGAGSLFYDDLSKSGRHEYRYDDLRAINGFEFSSYDNPAQTAYATSAPVDDSLDPWEWKLVCLFADGHVNVEQRGRCLSDLTKAIDEFL